MVMRPVAPDFAPAAASAACIAVAMAVVINLAAGGCGRDDTATVPRGGEDADRRIDRPVSTATGESDDARAAAEGDSAASPDQQQPHDEAQLTPLLPPETVRGAESPSALLTRLADGMLAGDVETVLACMVDPSPGLHRWAGVFGAAAELCHAQRALRRAVLGRFGTFRAVSFDAAFAVPSIAEPGRYEVMRQRRLELGEGDASPIPPGFTPPFTLTRRNGVWLLDPAGALAGRERAGTDPDQLEQRLRSLTEHRRAALASLDDAEDYTTWLEAARPQARGW